MTKLRERECTEDGNGRGSERGKKEEEETISEENKTEDRDRNGRKESK